ncbi:MAG TPA: 1-acyl-sn-glycerol-3-phosphate acyltransferase [Anaeromyxobacteraceae bacterium]|nr:1-acyl-sn-glycerol-3-phosphate acyltransferase [Anaeromyxobacteraceae bacterium]
MNDHGSSAAAEPAARPSFLDRWFRPVRVPREAPRELAELARRGSVVFVMRKAGLLNFLFLAWLLRQHGLPPLRAALGLTGVMPWLARVRASWGAVEGAIRAGDATVVFLGRASGPDPFPLLARLQRELSRPILLVPALLVWARRPQNLEPTLGDIFFGTPDAPRRLANMLGFVLNHRHAVLRLGRPADLAAFEGERPDEPDATVARITRGVLHLHLAREVRAVVGPKLKTPRRVRETVLRDKSLRATLEREARVSGRPVADLERAAERDLKEIASRYSAGFIEFVRYVLSWLFGRLYDAVDVDEEGLARVKRAAAEAPIVLCPSHKSHVDYLVLSWVFYMAGMTPPHVAAGINLAFWPFGPIARRGGAFFIRRTLKGDRVYTATLRAYVKYLLRDRFPQEFYLEGGRSRSGKLLFPKTGLFSMEVDAWLEQAADDVLFVPVAIDYERLMESGSYARELAGGEKRKEDFRGLLRARKVLGKRYGRLTIQFEEPVSLREFASRRLGAGATSLTLDDEPAFGFDGPAAAEPSRPRPSPRERGEGSTSAETKRAFVQALANRVAYGINRAISMTPTGLVAAALLAHTRRGLPAAELGRRVELLRSIARDQGARFSHGLAGAPADPLRPGPIADAVARLAEEGLVRVERAAGETIYLVREERRTNLDYHKNAVIHRFVPLALVATSLRALGGDAARDEVRERTRWVSRLLKLEFMFRVGVTFDELFAENAAELARVGAIVERAGRLTVGAEPSALEFLADLLRPYLEAYRVVAEAALAADRTGAPLDRRSLLKTSLEQGRAAWAAGRIALRESLSKATAENAVEWLAQQGALRSGETPARLAPAWRDASLPELIRLMDSHLSR